MKSSLGCTCPAAFGLMMLFSGPGCVCIEQSVPWKVGGNRRIKNELPGAFRVAGSGLELGPEGLCKNIQSRFKTRPGWALQGKRLIDILIQMHFSVFLLSAHLVS